MKHFYSFIIILSLLLQTSSLVPEMTPQELILLFSLYKKYQETYKKKSSFPLKHKISSFVTSSCIIIGTEIMAYSLYKTYHWWKQQKNEKKKRPKNHNTIPTSSSNEITPS